MNYIKLKIYLITCYLIGISMIMLVILSLIALLTENVPGFVGDIIQWILGQCPENDSLILLLYFIVFMVLIMVVPYLIAFFSFKKANKLAKKIKKRAHIDGKIVLIKAETFKNPCVSIGIFLNKKLFYS